MPEDLLDLLRKYPRDSWDSAASLSGLAEMWLARHRMFRELSAMSVRTTEAWGERAVPAGTFVATFSRQVGMLLGELENHHLVEDHHYFPAFARAEPRLRRGFDILDNDHGVIHEAIDSLARASRELIAAVTEGGDAGRPTEGVLGELGRFDRTLSRHLDDEEDLVIPLILERARTDPEFG